MDKKNNNLAKTSQVQNKIMCVVSNFDGVIAWREFTKKDEAVAWAMYNFKNYIVEFYAK